MKSKTWKILYLALSALFAVRAAADEPVRDMRPIVCIDVKNFVNKTDNKRANFSALVDRVNHEFVQTGLYRVLNLADAGEVMQKDDVFKVISDEGGNKVSIPVPGWLVRFTVVQYGVHKSSAVDRVTGAKSELDAATVEVILSIVDMRTGETIISKNLPPATCGIPRRTARGARQRGNYQEQALQAACREVALQTVQALIINTEFFLMDVTGGNIEVDIPASVAKPGQLFTVYRYGRARVSKRTGKKSFRKIPIGKIVLTKCDEESAMARPVGAFASPITTDCIVMWTKEEELPPPPPQPASVPPGARPF